MSRICLATSSFPKSVRPLQLTWHERIGFTKGTLRNFEIWFATFNGNSYHA